MKDVNHLACSLNHCEALDSSQPNREASSVACNQRCIPSRTSEHVAELNVVFQLFLRIRLNMLSSRSKTGCGDHPLRPRLLAHRLVCSTLSTGCRHPISIAPSCCHYNRTCIKTSVTDYGIAEGTITYGRFLYPKVANQLRGVKASGKNHRKGYDCKRS